MAAPGRMATVRRERNPGAGAPGMILVVVRGRETLLRGYGENTKGNGKEPDGPSLLRLGSISKVFATELLAGMAAEGQLRLTDPLQQYAAAAVTVPRFGDRAKTLLGLATHSAGLPREIGEAPTDTIPFTSPPTPPTSCSRARAALTLLAVCAPKQ